MSSSSVGKKCDYVRAQRKRARLVESNRKVTVTQIIMHYNKKGETDVGLDDSRINSVSIISLHPPHFILFLISFFPAFKKCGIKKDYSYLLMYNY